MPTSKYECLNVLCCFSVGMETGKGKQWFVVVSPAASGCFNLQFLFIRVNFRETPGTFIHLPCLCFLPLLCFDSSFFC